MIHLRVSLVGLTILATMLACAAEPDHGGPVGGPKPSELTFQPLEQVGAPYALTGIESGPATAIGDDSGYVGWSTPDGGRLSSIDLATGLPRWSVPTCAGGEWWSLAPTLTVVLAISGGDQPVLCVHDRATGKLRWQAPAPDGRLLLTENGRALVGRTMYELETGTRLFTLPDGVASTSVVDGYLDGETVLYAMHGKELLALRSSNGAGARRTPLPVTGAARVALFDNGSVVTIDSLSSRQDQIIVTDAFGPRVVYKGGHITDLISCDRGICLAEIPAEGGPSALVWVDLADGAEIRRVKGLGLSPRLDAAGQFVAVSDGRAGATLYLGGAPQRLNAPAAAVVFTDPNHALLLGSPTGGAHVETQTREPVVGYDLKTGAQTPLGSLAWNRCSWSDQYLICGGSANITIWRFARREA